VHASDAAGFVLTRLAFQPSLRAASPTGTGFAILYAIGVIYIPPFHSNDAFQTAFLHGAAGDVRLAASMTLTPASPGYFWLPQLASCLFLFAYNETVKHFIRKAPRGFVAKNFGW
jgi:hypothetical protein